MARLSLLLLVGAASERLEGFLTSDSFVVLVVVEPCSWPPVGLGLGW